MTGFTKTVSAAAVAVALGMGAVQTNAATVVNSGDCVAGWKITFPVGISLASDGGSTLTLEKNAAFDSLEGLDITFTQLSYKASPTITIDDESITNISGTKFTGFQFLALNTLPGSAAPASFDPNHKFNLSDPAESYFTTETNHADEIDFTGALPDTDTSKLGFGAEGGSVVIDANPASHCMRKVFELKEIPVAAVPLPAAGWTGLSGLLGLGLLANAKKLRKALA